MKEKGCKLDWKSTSSVFITGIVDEYADFSSLATCAGQMLYVDFSGVSRVNSSGLRSWIQTIQRNKIQLVLRDCSPSVVEQFAMIPEFVGKNGVVESFYARYQCVSCMHEENHRYQIGVNLDADTLNLDLQLATPCPQCGDVVELDHHAELYLTFLRSSKKPAAS